MINQKVSKLVKRFAEYHKYQEDKKTIKQIQQNQRQTLIDQAPEFSLPIAFLCNHCLEHSPSQCEFTAIGYKVVITSTQEPYAFYRTSCRLCNEDCIRYITNPINDPYFQDSPTLQRERYIHRKELLQPGDVGYDTYYGKSITSK